MARYYIGSIPCSDDSLTHYGVLGMKWGIRRYQNKDGTLTSAGKQRYQYESLSTKYHAKRAQRLQNKIDSSEKSGKNDSSRIEKLTRKRDRQLDKERLSRQYDKKEEDYARQVRTGGNIVSRIITRNLVGGKGYQMYLSMMGGDKSSSVGKKAVAAILSGLTGGDAFIPIVPRLVKEVDIAIKAKR